MLNGQVTLEYVHMMKTVLTGRHILFNEWKRLRCSIKTPTPENTSNPAGDNAKESITPIIMESQKRTGFGQ